MLLVPDEVDADAEDQDRAGEREVARGLRSHDRLQEAGEERHQPLKDRDRDGREDAPFAHRRGHDHDDDRIEDGFCDEQRDVAE